MEVNTDSQIRENFACLIGNPRFRNPEFSSRNPESCKRLESRKHVPLTRNLQKPQRGIHNPKKSRISFIECFYMTSRRPYWYPKTMKRRPCWCPKPILWELNSFLVQTLSFVPINLHRCWPREWKNSVGESWTCSKMAMHTSPGLSPFPPSISSPMLDLG